MKKVKDTISKLLYILLPLLLASPSYFFYQKLLEKLSVPQYRDILLKTMIGTFLLLLYAISWIIYLHSHKIKCPFCNSRHFELTETRLSHLQDLRKQGLIRYRYICNSCNKTFDEYVKPLSKPR